MKSLVIVETPTKAKTIQKFLGKDFIIKSSFGHVRDLPKRELELMLIKILNQNMLFQQKPKKLWLN